MTSTPRMRSLVMTTESEFEARRAKWNQIRGARVGDWYEMKGGRRHRFGKDLGEGLKLAAETLGDLFSLNDDGVATYAGLLLTRPAIRKSSLAGQEQSKREDGWFGVHRTGCRVFEENVTDRSR
jgi:hypothetical protein